MGLSFLNQRTKPYQTESEQLEDGACGQECDVPNVPAVIDPFDPAPMRDLFETFLEKINAMQAEAQSVVVTDDDSKAQAVTMIGQCKQIASAIEKQRKESKAPYLEMGKAIDGFANPLTAALKAIENTLGAAIRPYLIEQDRKRREAERKAREEQETALRAAMEAAEKRREEAAKQAAAGERPEPVAPVVMPAPATPPMPAAKTVTETATADVKRVWTGDIVDLAEVLTNPALISAREKELTKAVIPWVNAQVKAGVRSIPGVAIYQQEEIKTRVRK